MRTIRMRSRSTHGHVADEDFERTEDCTACLALGGGSAIVELDVVGDYGEAGMNSERPWSFVSKPGRSTLQLALRMPMSLTSA